MEPFSTFWPTSRTIPFNHESCVNVKKKMHYYHFHKNTVELYSSPCRTCSGIQKAVWPSCKDSQDARTRFWNPEQVGGGDWVLFFHRRRCLADMAKVERLDHFLSGDFSSGL
jgi:hypothetical protein